MNSELITLIVRIITLLIVMYIIPQVKRWLGQKGLLPYAESIVRAMEMIFKEPHSGESKKEEATKLIIQYCNQWGLELSADAISAVIEAFVYELNRLKEG